MILSQRSQVMLVAPVPDNSENLSLAYVAKALKVAGHSASISTFRGVIELEETARRVAKHDPSLVGVSISSAVAAIDCLAFILRIRMLGYNGHITCGGPYATICREKLLNERLEIDSVVRHDGEYAIGALADALLTHKDLRGVPGVSTRSGDGPPIPLCDPKHLQQHPERPVQKSYAGVKTAKISASLGCHGGCNYCGLKALRKDARAEGRRFGYSTAQMKRAGVGGIRRRPVDSVADEMAQLYNQNNVRFFHFVDENYLSKSAGEAVRSIEELTEALDSRGVKKRAVNMMLRSDVVTPEVVKALDELGLARCLLGVESMDTENLMSLGRGSEAEQNIAAMNALAQTNVMFHFNVLLVHPDSTIASIKREIEGLKQVRGGLVDPFQMEIYEGTNVFERLRKEDRLEGGPLLWHFWPQEPAARRFAELFYATRRDALGFLHLTAFAYEVLGAFAVARRLGMIKRNARELDRLSDRLVNRANALWLEMLNRMVRLCERPLCREDTEAFFAELKVRFAELIMEFDNLKSRVDGSCGRSLFCDVVYPHTLAAVSVAAAILATVGCQTAPENSHHNDGGIVDADTDTDTDTATETATDADTDTGCDISDVTEEVNQIMGAAVVEGGCDNICTLSSLEIPDFNYRFVLDEGGHVVDIEADSGVQIPDGLKECYLNAVEGQVFPCLGQQGEFWHWCGIALS